MQYDKHDALHYILRHEDDAEKQLLKGQYKETYTDVRREAET